jgi:hypothetical protein
MLSTYPDTGVLKGFLSSFGVHRSILEQAVATQNCIYCWQDKDDSEFTLEHVIPQFLGGAYGPDSLKTRHVCKQCNSNLGLFADAGFEKNWLVSNQLRDAAVSFFDPDDPIGLPLTVVC